MLLCDGCDLGFHMQCLTPPLSEVVTYIILVICDLHVTFTGDLN